VVKVPHFRKTTFISDFSTWKNTKKKVVFAILSSTIFDA